MVTEVMHADVGKNSSLFDEFGRRIPLEGMRVHAQVSRRYFTLKQPEINYGAVWHNFTAHVLHQEDHKHEVLAFGQVQERCQEIWLAILAGIRDNEQLANLAQAVHVPFVCTRRHQGTQSRAEEIQVYIQAAEQSFRAKYGGLEFYNLCPGLPSEEIRPAFGSRYELFEVMREQALGVAGIWFPNCLSEFDLASQRKQMQTLPESVTILGAKAPIVLSGIVEAAAGLVSCPDLFANPEQYASILCLSALEEPEKPVFYSFEADSVPDGGYNLVFRQRSNILTRLRNGTLVPQLSEQWAGGLTVFTAIL